jgi:hypothetical protein
VSARGSDWMDDDMDLADALFALEHELGDGDGTTLPRFSRTDSPAAAARTSSTRRL